VLRPAPVAWRLLRAAGDLATAVAAFYAAFQVRIRFPLPYTRFLLPPERLAFFGSEWWVVAASQVLALYFFGFYDPPRGAGAEGTRRLFAATALQGLALSGFYFLTKREFPRSVLLLFVAGNFLLLALWRAAVERLYRPPRRRVAIVGTGPSARELMAKVEGRGSHGIEVVGFVPAPDEEEPGPGLVPCLGTLDDLPALLARGLVDDVILASGARHWQTRLLDQLAAVRPASGSLLLLPGPVESLIGRMRYRWVDDVPLIEVVRQSEWRLNRPVKRLMDLLGVAILLAPAALAAGLAALAIALTSPGPILYRQVRIGRGRRPFTLWKLRTMQPDAERDTGEVLATPGDPRLAPLGALLRGLRLDELPQLWNVLAGSMSLVGPRPERPGFVERYLAEVPGYAERFAVPPGLTGLAQVNGDYQTSAENKLRYDLAYIANWSPWLDLAILFRTVKIVLTSRGT
jgi:exopolysaccharide biosynthesis polyprenyl glycosylphosphotransferase